MKTKIFYFITGFIFLFCSHSAHAQYWSPWQKTHNTTLGFSADEKWAFFIQKNDAGISNIYKIDLKTNTVSPVTNFTERPVQSGIVLLGKPAIVYTRAASSKGDDIHLYRVNVLTNDEPIDITPSTGTSNKKILALSYNGRYVYFLSDKGANTKSDTHRYDTQQYIDELSFPNDKNFETLSWSRDQKRLMLRDPKTMDVYDYNIETTSRDKISLPGTGADLKTVFYDPMNTSLYAINKNDQLAVAKMNSSDISALSNGNGIKNGNLSLNGKYFHILTENSEKVIGVSPNDNIDLPSGAYDLIVSPKETSVLYVTNDGGVMKLSMYDIAKKTSKELTVIK